MAPRAGNAPDAWPAVAQALVVLAGDIGLAPALRERLLEVAKGLSYRQISSVHGISVNTVKTQVKALLGCVGASCVHEVRAAARAACARAEAGASRDEIVAFLRLRFE